MNNNTIAYPPQKPRELNQGGTSTSETAFTSDGSTPVVLPLPKSLVNVNSVTWAPTGSGGASPSRRFKVVAVGRVTTAGSYNITVRLFFGTSATLASDTAIATTGVVAVATASANWQIEATLVWDATSQKIDGFYQACLNGTRVAPTIITNAVTGADPAGSTALGFVIAGTFGTGNASNTMNLDWFVLMLA